MSRTHAEAAAPDTSEAGTPDTLMFTRHGWHQY